MPDDRRARTEEIERRRGQGARRQSARLGERDRVPRREHAVGREERLVGAERFARKGDEFDE